MTKRTIIVQRAPPKHAFGNRAVTIWDRRRRNPRARLRLTMANPQADLEKLTAWLKPRVDDPGQWIVENLPDLWARATEAAMNPKGKLQGFYEQLASLLTPEQR